MILPSGKSGTLSSSARIPNDLILNLDFSNDYGWAGNTANDLSNRSIKYRTPGGFVSVVSGSTAEPGYIELDGSTDYLQTASTLESIPAISSDLTSCSFNIWFNPIITSTLNKTILSTTSTTSSVKGFSLISIYSTPSMYPRFTVNTGSTIVQSLQLTGLTYGNLSISGITLSGWHNLFLRADWSTAGITLTGKIFKPDGTSAANYTGVFDSTAGITTGIRGITGNFVTIGRRESGTLQYHGGRFGSIRMYNRLLTPEEIEIQYNQNKKRYGHS